MNSLLHVSNPSQNVFICHEFHFTFRMQRLDVYHWLVKYRVFQSILIDVNCYIQSINKLYRKKRKSGPWPFEC